MSHHRLDLSPSTDTTAHQLATDSETVLCRALYAALRSAGYNSAESVRIVHRHNGYEPGPLRVPLSDRFVRRA